MKNRYSSELMNKGIFMNSKGIFGLLILIILTFFLVSSINAADNKTIVSDNNANENYNLQFNQSYEPSVVHKDDVVEVYLHVKNVGQDTYHNLSILYPLPQGLNLLIFPVEYDNSTWFIDTLYPGEDDLLTLVCVPTIAGKTYEFTAGVGSQTIMNSTMDMYVEGENTNSSNGTDIFDGGVIKAVGSVNNSDLSLKQTANPILVLLFAIIFIPFIRIKY